MSNQIEAGIAERLEYLSGSATTTNQSRSGYWLRIALASEALASVAPSSANESVTGYMRRAALALATATDGEFEDPPTNQPDAYLASMIANLEAYNGESYEGSAIWRLWLGVSGLKGPDLKGDGTVGLIGTATEATYDPVTGEGTVYRAANSGNQSYVSWTELDPAKTYEIQISVSGPSGVSIRSGGALGAVVATVFSGTTATPTFQPDANGDATISISANDTSATFTVHHLREVGA